jgi:hypothetical protein
MDLAAEDIAELVYSNLSFIRTHSTQRTYTMEMLTNPVGVVGHRQLDILSAQTLPWLFSLMLKVNTNPWLQIVLGTSEAEWMGFMEYMAAPWNPAVDTALTKPWAYKRAVLQVCATLVTGLTPAGPGAAVD